MPQSDTFLKVRYLTLPISEELAGTEVNTLLRRRLGLSGTVLRRVKWLPDGITVDGERVNVRCRVAAGQVLSVRLSDPDTAGQPVPRPGPLDLVYEDEDMVVVNKSPGVLVHPSHGHYADTVGNTPVALPYGLASDMMRDDDNDYRCQDFRQKYVLALSEAVRALPEPVRDVY